MRFEHPEEVEVQRTVGQHQGKQTHQQQQSLAAQPEHEEAEQQVGYVLEHHAPLRNVQHKHLAVGAYVPLGRDGDHAEAGQNLLKEVADARSADAGIVVALLKIEQGGTEQHTEEHHGLQADQTRLEEVPAAHPAAAHPPLVGIADDKAGEHEKEVDTEITMVQVFVHRVVRERFTQVKNDHHQGCHASQAV